MSAILAWVAIVFAGVALGLAIAADRRTRRATRSLAREMVDLRQALQERPRAAPSAPEQEPTAAGEAWREAFGLRLEAAERRVLDLYDGSEQDPATEVPMAARRAGAAGLRDQVRAGLRRQGFDRVQVLELTKDNAARVEIERDGIVRKGIARVTSDGRVDLKTVSSLRAFP